MRPDLHQLINDLVKLNEEESVFMMSSMRVEVSTQNTENESTVAMDTACTSSAGDYEEATEATSTEDGHKRRRTERDRDVAQRSGDQAVVQSSGGDSVTGDSLTTTVAVQESVSSVTPPAKACQPRRPFLRGQFKFGGERRRLTANVRQQGVGRWKHQGLRSRRERKQLNTCQYCESANQTVFRSP